MLPLANMFRRIIRQAEPEPESFSSRLERARSNARRFALRQALDPNESEVVLSASVTSAILSPGDADWQAASVRELERFRAACRKRGGTAEQEVDFIEGKDWPESWLDEPRLYIVYAPRLGAANEFPRDYAGGAYLQTCHGSLTAKVQTVCRLSFVSVYRRVEPWLWKGSKVNIRESAGPLELKGIGGNFTDTTVVSADASLAAPTFDYARALIEQAGATCREDEGIWLAIGLPIEPETALPTPRPVGREETIDDPVSIKRRAPRVSLEVLQATRTTYEPPKISTTLARIMAVERP
jgi:hypothetical protein